VADDINTDIALIKKDIKQIEKFFGRVESSMESLVDVSKMTAVQEEVLRIAGERLDDLEDRIESHRKEDESRVVAVHKKLDEYRDSSREDHKRLAEHTAKNRTKHDTVVIEKIDNVAKEVTKTLDEHGERLRTLENWKYYMMGLGAAVAFIGLERFM
jgi:predicted P-loop ATPase/GTPase